MSKLSPKKLLGLVAALVVVLVLGVLFTNTSDISDEEIGTPPGVVIDTGFNATLSGSPYYFVTAEDEDLYDDSLDTCKKKGDNDDRLENQNGWYRLVAYKDDMTVREVVFEQVELKEDDPTVIFYYNAEDQKFEAQPNRILRNADGTSLPQLDLDKKLKKGEVVVVTSSRAADFCVNYSEGTPHTNVFEGWNLISKPTFDEIDFRSVWEVALAKGGNSGTDPIKFFPAGNNNFDVNTLSNDDLYWVYVGSGGVVGPGGGNNNGGNETEQTINVLVKDKDGGDALVGANVLIKGSTTASQTDADGKTSLKTTEDSVTLVASFTGYESKEAAVTDYSKEVVIELEASQTVELGSKMVVTAASGIITDIDGIGLKSEDDSKIKSFNSKNIKIDVEGSSKSYDDSDFDLTLKEISGKSRITLNLKNGNWNAGDKLKLTFDQAFVEYEDGKVNPASEDALEVRASDDTPEDPTLEIEDVFSITGRGTVVTGPIRTGTAKVGEEITVFCGDFSLKALVTGIQGAGQQTLDEANVGDNVGVLLRGISRDDIKCGSGNGGTDGGNTAVNVSFAGTVYEEGTSPKAPINGVEVKLTLDSSSAESTATTDTFGKFKIDDLDEKKGSATFSKDGYESKTVSYDDLEAEAEVALVRLPNTVSKVYNVDFDIAKVFYDSVRDNYWIISQDNTIYRYNHANQWSTMTTKVRDVDDAELFVDNNKSFFVYRSDSGNLQYYEGNGDYMSDITQGVKNIFSGLPDSINIVDVDFVKENQTAHVIVGVLSNNFYIPVKIDDSFDPDRIPFENGSSFQYNRIEAGVKTAYFGSSVGTALAKWDSSINKPRRLMYINGTGPDDRYDLHARDFSVVTNGEEDKLYVVGRDGANKDRIRLIDFMERGINNEAPVYFVDDQSITYLEENGDQFKVTGNPSADWGFFRDTNYRDFGTLNLVGGRTYLIDCARGSDSKCIESSFNNWRSGDKVKTVNAAKVTLDGLTANTDVKYYDGVAYGVSIGNSSLYTLDGSELNELVKLDLPANQLVYVDGEKAIVSARDTQTRKRAIYEIKL